MAKLLITGAAGRIGTAIAPLLREQGQTLRLLDLLRPKAATDDDTVVIASATDLTSMTHAATGMDLVLHLAGYPGERTWRDMIDVNVESTRVALESARATGVPVTVLASSVHAAGFTPSDAAGARVPAPRPDTYYGVSKVVGEALGSLYADRFGMTVVSARIMNFDDRPRSVRSLRIWVSPADLTRLVLAALTAPAGHHIVWGVSANSRGVVDLAAGRAIGFEPRDDAEAFADVVAREAGFPDATHLPPAGDVPIGGDFADRSRPLGEDWG
ncbi:NAD-dependent epimerase/dehydratase family protein [uncultured Amnibacterium sp.]|uniref:NAD-dependent epimerase/dehydratase family protein n=1 Tax=uncultured Amnibacterium sp. TaxID=1631851 RepID=UPI0035C97884